MRSLPSRLRARTAITRVILEIENCNACSQGEGGPIFLAATAQFSAVLYTGLSPRGKRRKGGVKGSSVGL
jgi:hypothetical protein